MPRRFEPTSESAKLSLTLTAEAAGELRKLAEDEGLTLAEVVRRSLGLYRFVQSLSPDEELFVKDVRSGETTRLALVML